MGLFFLVHIFYLIYKKLIKKTKGPVIGPLYKICLYYNFNIEKSLWKRGRNGLRPLILFGLNII